MNLENKNVENIVEDNMMGYSASVLLDRAIPDVRDGLKPAYRRILWAMQYMKATRFTKSANVTGEVMRFHPHGDSYSTIVGMAQKDRHAIPFIVGKGNFGQYTSKDLAPAASRYSEVKLSEISLLMMESLNKNMVDMIDNYDGTRKMPEVLPTPFPTILAYAQSGIGVGISSSLPSFNIVETCDAIEKYISNGEKTLLIPDFATRGSIINDEEIFNKINYEGNGSVRLRGNAEIVKGKIIINEVPYGVKREAIIDKIISLVKDGKLKEITDVKDLTDLKGMRISITTRKNVNLPTLIEKLYSMTPLEASYSANMNILVNNLPKALGVWGIIEEWVTWRRGCIKRGLINEVTKMREQLHIYKGLEKVLIDIDEAIEIIRHSEQSEIESNLIREFELDLEQATEVANMKLRNINPGYIEKKIASISLLEDNIKSTDKIINADDELNKLIVSGLKSVAKQYNEPRRTKLIEVSGARIQRTVKKEVQNYPVNVLITKDGYCYKFKNDESPWLKPGDEVIKKFVTENIGELVVFCDDKGLQKIPLDEITEAKTDQIGVFINSLLRNDVKPVTYAIIDSSEKVLIHLYAGNRIAKVSLKTIKGSSRRVLRNAYHNLYELLDTIIVEDGAKIKIITQKTKGLLDTSKLPLMDSRITQGSKLALKEKIIHMEE